MFTRFLVSKTEHAYVFLRVVTGLLFGFHGMQKLFGYQLPAEYIPKIGSQGWIGGIIELATGILMALGVCTRCAAFLASGTMAVAYTQFHWKFALGANFFPPVNQGELALVFSVLFLFMACKGGGPWAIERLWKKSETP